MALIANIESREWRRQFCSKNGLPPEHPRASSTDDVECFFSVLRDNVGKDFTLKEVCMYTCSDAPIADYLIIPLVTNTYKQYNVCT